MSSLGRLRKATKALDELEREQNVHSMGACDAFGTYPGLIREFDAALNAAMDEGLAIPARCEFWARNRGGPPDFVRVEGAKSCP